MKTKDQIHILKKQKIFEFLVHVFGFWYFIFDFER